MTNVSFACLTIVFYKKNSSIADVKVRMDKMWERKRDEKKYIYVHSSERKQNLVDLGG